MELKGTGPTTLTQIDRWEGGFGWLVYPTELMQRAGHALLVDDELWLIDPLDGAGLDDILAEYGRIAGVVITLDRHTRDAAVIAHRHDVQVWFPTHLRGTTDAIDGSVRMFTTTLPGTGYRAIPVVDWPFWREVALYNDDDGTLVVGDALGTGPYFTVGDERIGVQPFLRFIPPRRTFEPLAPKRILVGHGEGVMEDATAILRDALRGARRRIPRLYAQDLRLFLPI